MRVSQRAHKLFDNFGGMPQWMPGTTDYKVTEVRVPLIQR
jgi:hypothetical protein